MSYGNGVIANGTPENIEVVGDAGVIFEKNNFEDLARILSELLSSPDKISELGERAKDRVARNYSWDSVVARYEELIGALVSGKSDLTSVASEASHAA
jgi:glycosyltransferase involved in cell wall biosynthesis